MKILQNTLQLIFQLKFSLKNVFKRVVLLLSSFLDSETLGCLVAESVDVSVFAVHGQVSGDGHHLGAVQAQLGQPTQVNHSPKSPWFQSHNV